jgi:hypothetical protein
MRFGNLMKKFTKALFLLIALFAKTQAFSNQKDFILCQRDNLAVTLSPLYWKANEEITSSWANNFLKTNPNVIQNGYFNPETVYFNWNFGSRLEATWAPLQSDYQFKGLWTHYRTYSTQSGAIEALGAIFLSQFFEGFLSEDLAIGGKVHWVIQYEMVDLLLSHEFTLANKLKLSPYVGIKGGFVKQSIDCTFLDLYPDFLYKGYESLTNNFYGIGPEMGLETSYPLLKNQLSSINLFGNFSLATLWGNFCSSDTYYNTQDYVKSSIYGIGHDPFGGVNLSALMGASWEYYFNNKNKLTLQAAFEIQYWVNQLRLTTFQLLRLHGDLLLQGATFNIRFDY